MALTANMIVEGSEEVTAGQSSDHFATISLNSQRASQLSRLYSDERDKDNDDEDSDNTLGNSTPQRPASGGVKTGSAGSLSLDGQLDGRVVRPPSAAAPSSLRLAEMRSGAQFSAQRFYSSAGSWIFPGLLGSCFRPMWNNLFPTRNEPSLTSSSSDGSGDGEASSGLAKSAGLEVSLEQIDVNFKEDYIGGGNQSSVFRGKFSGRYIALKKLNRASEVDILTLASLNHDNIIKTIGVCTRDIYPIIVMEYCEQGGLFDVLHKVDVTKTRFLQWAGEIVDGMRYLHSRKIVHRDLKSPNILVDSDDRLKICDFGSLYAWEKTYMPSVVMSVCGTSQWMSPEMLKNEPCNEKVDVWSFGVVLWELLTQEVPYKSISPMAIMYGVGSGQLKLHVPKSAPPILEMLFGVCWAKRPRNRPSFVSIATHLANLRVSLADMSEDAWQMRKSVWRREICEENAKRCVFSGNNNNNAKDQEAEELIVKRRHELRHLQELRTVYERKTERAERYTREVFAFYEEIRRYEAELMQRELEMFGENRVHRSLLLPPDDDVLPGLSVAPSTNANTEPSRRCRFRNRLLKMEKSMIVQLNDSTTRRMDYNNCSNKINSCGNSGKFAVVTLSVDDENGPESRRQREAGDCSRRQAASSIYYPNGYDYADDDPSTDEPTSSTESSICSLRASDDDEEDGRDEECGRTNVDAMGRMTAISRDDRINLDSHQQSNSTLSQLGDSLSVTPLQLANNHSNIPTTCPCCQHQFFFDRNSLARASNISSDSGFCYSEEAATTTRSSTNHCISGLSTTGATKNCPNPAFERFHPNNTSIKASRTCAAALGGGEALVGRLPRNRPIHIGAIGRANGISNGSLGASRPLGAIRQSGSYSFDESRAECSHPGHLYRNVQGRWSDGKIKQRGTVLAQQQKRRASRQPTGFQSPAGMIPVSENPMHPVPNAAPRFTRPSPSNLPASQLFGTARQETKLTNFILASDLSENIIGSPFETASSTRKFGNSPHNQLGSRPIATKDARTLRHKVLNKEAPVDSVDHHHLHFPVQMERAVDVETNECPRYAHNHEFQRQSSSRELGYRRPAAVKRQYSSSQLLARQTPPAREAKEYHSPEQGCDAVPPDTYSNAAENELFEILEIPKTVQTESEDESAPKAIDTSVVATTELERSLEAAAAYSDGLSDKERELRAAKSSFKTHRRTASNPIYVPSSSYRTAEVCETSTDSETDHIYC